MEGPALHLSQIDADRRKFKGFLDVPFQSWSSGTTVADLEKEVASQTGLRVVYIAYRGMRLAKDTQLSSLILDLQEGSCPRFSVHTTSGDNVFFVKSLRGSSVMVDLPLNSSTVRELKEEVEVLEKIPSEYQRFVYNGKHLADSEPITKTLRDYGVERDSTVQLLTRMRGGGPDVPAPIEFADVQNESALEVLPWSKDAPIWRFVGKGLNLEGKCTNEKCIAHGHMVVCMKGFAAVNLAKEQGHCPICKQAVRVKTCSFTKCTWMYEGRKAVVDVPKPARGFSQRYSELTGFLTQCFGGKLRVEDEEYPAKEKQGNRDIISPWFKASSKYEYFKQANNMVKWENLLIVAKKRPTVSKNAPGHAVPHDEPCSICFQKFGSNTDVKNHTTSCGHTFHADCVESWLSCGGTACPVCRVDLVVEQ
ncbi:hypothetical protein KC19_1G297800 [Ceratodon purpureus]|uniref:Uncharacterized protein n=1 Tax=Ceratodon purpureus TaxID=3225 RepID=A0A8T0JDU2_CERPU|nr:hypothetical protein KC19_1G297800 [Ceratodon purpureus]KAG0593009.1 hypothetical protein KC19_1G297800 [Ceratodon purpureus]